MNICTMIPVTGLHFEEEKIFISERDFILKDSTMIFELMQKSFISFEVIMFLEDLKRTNTPVIFLRNTQKNDLGSDEMFKYIMMYHNFFLSFSMALWLIKDNSVNIQYSFHEFDKVMRFNRKDSVVSNISGLYKDTFYSMEEIHYALDTMAIINDINSDSNTANFEEVKKTFFKSTGGIYTPSGKFTDFNRMNRLSKSFYFLFSARATTFVPAKIASYTSAIESLLSSSKDSVVKNVTERVANILGGDFEEKKQLMIEMKNIYNSRSVFIHGSEYGNKAQKNIYKYAESVDDILRKLINLFIYEDEFKGVYLMNDKELDEWYMKKYVFNS